MTAHAELPCANRRAKKLLAKMSTKPSGLQLCDLSTGDGGRPKRGRKVRCNYSLRLGGPTGLLVEQSGSRPFEFRLGLGEVIKGWDEVRIFPAGFHFVVDSVKGGTRSSFRCSCPDAAESGLGSFA